MTQASIGVDFKSVGVDINAKLMSLSKSCTGVQDIGWPSAPLGFSILQKS